MRGLQENLSIFERSRYSEGAVKTVNEADISGFQEENGCMVLKAGWMLNIRFYLLCRVIIPKNGREPIAPPSKDEPWSP